MKKRLKIAEQILIVLLLALILPLIIAAAIIINTNQIAVRKELSYSATIIAKSVSDELISLQNFEHNSLFYVNEALKKISKSKEQKAFLTQIKNSNKNILELEVLKFPSNITVMEKYNTQYLKDENVFLFSFMNSQNEMIVKKVNHEYLEAQVFDNLDAMKRQIYVFDKDKNLIISKNKEEKRVEDIIEMFPENIENNEVISFGKYKNQPNIMVYSPDYELYIVVSSPKNLTYYGIIEARRKIIFSICIAAVAAFVLFGVYVFSLYTNIRQIFKVIQAVTAGNYTRKIRVLITWLTPQEIIFIAEEFNKMIEKINESYKELHENNIKLKQMDEYKSNLIDTVSHEFRTPLTSIKGYASSLLRHDIHIDDEARKKSLKIIKHQAERLSRMVEDLLVIPDIESATLRMNYKEVDIKNVIETSMLYTVKDDSSVFEAEIIEDLKTGYCDEDRLIQIFINLLENAIKYSKENTKIKVYANNDDKFVRIKIHNEAENIDEKMLNKLFEKFTRIDSNLTRTTRGTGLGLFIVKGLVETMGGQISLSADNGFDVEFTIPVYMGQDENE